MPAQQVEEPLVVEGSASRLDGVPQRSVLRDGRQQPVPGEPVVVPLRQSGRLRRRARQPGEERVDDRGVEREPFGQLPQDRTELAAQRQHAAREEVRQRRVDVDQPLHVRDEPSALDGEDEVVGRLVMPPRVRRRALEGVERAVDLDGGQPLGGVLELAPVRQTLRVEVTPPSGVRPAGDADPDLRHRPRLASRARRRTHAQLSAPHSVSTRFRSRTTEVESVR